MEGSLNENYYDILNIRKDASMDDIKKAYRKMAFQYHPDKNKDAGAEEKFKLLLDAYKVLSDPLKRKWYDDERRSGFNSGGRRWSGFADNEDPRETFRNYFPEFHDRYFDDADSFDMRQEKYSNSSKMSDSKSFREQTRESSSSSNCEYTNTESSGRCGNKRKPTSNNGFAEKQNFPSKRPCTEQSSTSTSSPQKDATIEKPLEVSLEELNTGCTKKLRIKRTINDERPGSSRQEEKVVEIEVKPGWKAGTRITFPEEGDKHQGRTPADIMFIIKDKPHSLFSRDSDNNLIHKANISLKSALLGLSYCFHGLNGKRQTVNISDIIHPGFVKRFPGEGLPLPKTPTKRGDLVVTFDIQFPKSLSWDQRRTLSECLPG